VVRVVAPITAQSFMQMKNCGLHKSQAFCWAPRETASPAWVKMTAGSSRVHLSCDNSRKCSANCLKQLCLEWCFLELALCFSHEQLQLQCSFLRPSSMQCSKQLGGHQDSLEGCLADSPLLKAVRHRGRV
jgi:hypothetical protein